MFAPFPLEFYLNYKVSTEIQGLSSTDRNFQGLLRADVSKYRPKVYKSEKSKILKKIHKVALGKLLT